MMTMVDKDEVLGLGLSLMPPTFSFSLHQQQQQHSSPWAHLLPSSGDRDRGLKEIDVNRAPATEREIEEDDEAGVSSPNSTVSSASGKRGCGEENEAERASSSRGISDEEEDGEGSRKKLRLSKDQSAVLEESFKDHNTLNPKQKLALAKKLNVRPRQVEVWFQNRRARMKLKQTEVEYEVVKRCCESLTEENRRLQKEVQELRALKRPSPHQLYDMQMTPPTTLTMCPSCERVSSSSSAASAHQLLRPMAPWAVIPLQASVFDAPARRS